MRRFVVLAALVVAGCQVELEGAKCETDGHCPGDQACGLDGTCSERAAACRDARDTPGVKRCADGVITVFVTTSDPVCGTWEPVETCAEGLVCAEGIAACACAPVADGAFHFDPTRATLPGIEPTGAAEPAACRLATLEDALAQATTAGPGSRVIAAAGAAEYALAAPLEIPAGVTLTTSTPTDATRHTLVIPALATSTTAAVVLHGGAALEGFTIRNDGAVTGRGISFSCDGTTMPALRHVRVLAQKSETEQFAAGIVIGESCSAELDDVTVSGATGAALLVDAGADAPATIVRGGEFEGSSHGLEVRSGAVTVVEGTQPARLARNRGHGIFATYRDAEPPYPPIELFVTAAEITDNEETGVRLQDLPPETVVSLNRLEIHGNRATTQQSEHASLRRAGGVVLQGAPPASFSLRGSRIYQNDADQLGMYAPEPWLLSGLDPEAPAASQPCDAAVPNVFACPSSNGYLVYSSSAGADATWNVWDVDPPTLLDVARVNYSPTFRSNCPEKPMSLPACARSP